MSIIARAEKNGLDIRCKNGIVRADDHDRFGEIACYFISRNPEGFTVEVQTDATYYCLGDEASFPVRKVVSTHETRLAAIIAAKTLCAKEFLQHDPRRV